MTTKTVQAHPHAIAAREERRAEALAMGIDEPFIADLVDRFYAAVRVDAILGPVFDPRVDDWPKHLRPMNSLCQSFRLPAGHLVCNWIERKRGEGGKWGSI